jgi:hypothetical protein
MGELKEEVYLSDKLYCSIGSKEKLYIIVYNLLYQVFDND